MLSGQQPRHSKNSLTTRQVQKGETPQQLVEEFYSLLDKRQYKLAYSLTSSYYHAQNPFSSWVSGYAQTASQKVVDVHAIQAIPGAVGFILESKLSNGISQAYIGIWLTKTNSNNHLELYKPLIYQIQSGKPYQCMSGTCPDVIPEVIPPATPSGQDVNLVIYGNLGQASNVKISFITSQTWPLQGAAPSYFAEIQVPTYNGNCQGCASNPKLLQPGIYSFIIYSSNWLMLVYFLITPSYISDI